MSESHSCPKCSSKEVVPIIYGLPSEAGMDRMDRGEAVAGGCDSGRNSPDLHCKACEHRWQSEAGRAEMKDFFDQWEALSGVKFVDN